jgi:hypothetical protein
VVTKLSTKKLSRLMAITAAIATLTVATVGINPAVAQTVALNSNKSTKLEGYGGGGKRDSGCAGFIADSPNHQVKISQDGNFRFLLEGSEESTLLIVGAQNQRFCVQADKVSKGKAEIPGRWSRGTYDVYVGSRNRGGAGYTLTIEPL